MNSRPNILMIMTDQQRWDSLGCYGADWIETPNLDRLASGGMLFDSCYVNNPVCTPSRASIFTGKHLPGHGVHRLHDILSQEEILFPRYLQDLGYTTALFGKLHVSGRVEEEARRHPNDGFDEYEWTMEASISLDSPFNGYSRWLKKKDPEFHSRLKQMGRKLTYIPREYHFTHWAAERTIDFINRQSDENPFFCLMSIFDPHNPYDDFPAEYGERVNIEKMPMPRVHDFEQKHTIDEIRREQQDGYFGDYSDITKDDFVSIRRGYYASIALLDDEVGRVLNVLEEKGIADKTLVIFLSDHGDMLGDHGLLVKGAFFYDPCVRVPLIIRQPGIVVAGVRSKALVQPHDVASTVLSAAGASREDLHSLMPDSMDLRSAVVTGHKTAVCTYRETGICNTGRYFDPPIYASMVFDGRYKLNIYHPHDESADSLTGQLFDLEEDPRESNDLFYTDIKTRLRLTEEFMHWQFRMLKTHGRHGASALPGESQLIKNRFLNHPADTTDNDNE